MSDPQLPNGFAHGVRITLDVHRSIKPPKNIKNPQDMPEQEEPEELDVNLPTSKVDAVIKIILEIFKSDQGLPASQQRKVLICSAWVVHLPKMVALLAKAGIPTAVMHGSTSPKERTRISTAFQADNDHTSPHGPSRVLIISPCLQAGLNFFRANIHLINLDPSWTQAARDQIVGRVHRIGQTRPVQVYNLIVRHSVDEYLASVAARKGRLMEVLDKHACLSPLLVDHEAPTCDTSVQRPPKRPISEDGDDDDDKKVEESLDHNKRSRRRAESAQPHDGPQ
ncbi:putative global transactivator [Vanrija pseudolonga]|uniref:Global transactivator n=1 Tax=Vanrija pseudolonga TaxID=143232 RepID=A0AAF0Y7V8_9TREE|nr:putative global transactivator [Vanrija pseudolonga]